MDADEFRAFGKEAVDFVAEYLENIRERDVLPSVEPGYLHDLLPHEAPEQAEDWRVVMADLKKHIMPGLTHWQSPNFHAYYPTATSYPSVVAEIILNGLGVVGFTWVSHNKCRKRNSLQFSVSLHLQICSPACTELEVIMMDWLAKILGLPEHFLNSAPGTGGGVIQGSASESCMLALVAGREQTVRRYRREHPEMTEGEVRAKLVAYSSDQGNSCIEKAGILAGVPMRLLHTDEICSLRGETLKKAIEKDLAQGLIPCAVLCTLGTTATCAFDNLTEIGPLCKEHELWLHIDAAYAGSAFICEENRHYMKGIEHADSFNFNLHKWMLVNFDCCAMWLKDSEKMIRALTVQRIYLSHKYENEKSKAPDYRHWTTALGRRMRSLKVWFTLRTIGVENIRARIRSHIAMAKMFEGFVLQDDRFEIITKAVMGVVVFRLKTGCEKTRELLEYITEKKKIYMIAGSVHGNYGIRFVVCGIEPEERDIVYAWQHILENLREIELEQNKPKQVVEKRASVEEEDFTYAKEISAMEAMTEMLSLTLATGPMQEKSK